MSYWLLPLALTLWLAVWVGLGYRAGGMFVLRMRLVGGVLLAASGWLIWWLMDGVRYVA